MGMGLLNVYSTLIANWLNGGAFSRVGKMEATSIDATYNLIFTKNRVKQIYRITGIKPENIDIDFVSYIRTQMFDLNPDVEIIINMDCHPAHLSVTDDKFQRAFTKATENYETYQSMFDSLTGAARFQGKTLRLPGGGRFKLSKSKLDTLKQFFLSYKNLFDVISSGGTVSLVNVFIEIVGKDTKSVIRAGTNIRGLFSQFNIGCEVVKSATKAYMLECGPATGSSKTLNKKFLPQLLFTDDDMAAFSPYKERGLVGGGKNGLLIGMDFRSRLPLSIDIFRAASAQVFMLLGKTGSGKTFTAFQVALSALALGEYVSAIDIKGREWVKISPFVDTKLITFDDRNPNFVNTLRLDDIDLSLVNPLEVYNTAVKGTVQLFALICNLQENEGNRADIELVLHEAVMKMFSIRHIDPANPLTFKNTANMRYSEVLPILDDLTATITYTPEQKAMAKLARSRINAYFGDSGLFSDAFRNEVTLSDVMETPLVIYELNKNQGAMTDSLDVIRVFMIQFLDSKKKAMLKDRGKFLFCFYEELQRCDQFGNLLSYICADVTGSRSNNAVIFLLLNSLKVLQGKEAQDIRSNITSFLVGYVEDNDIRSIENDFGKPWMAHQLQLFSDNQTEYRNCFAADVDTGLEHFETVFKVDLPDTVTRMFQTRTTKEG